MAINKEALYATVPAPFVMGGTDQWENGSQRFMRKKEYLYVVDLEKPEAPYLIPRVMPLEDSEIYMLGHDAPLKWRHEWPEDDEIEEGYYDEIGQVVIEEMPDPLPCDYAWSFRIQIHDRSW
jgi:hypothetical protein